MNKGCGEGGVENLQEETPKWVVEKRVKRGNKGGGDLNMEARDGGSFVAQVGKYGMV